MLALFVQPIFMWAGGASHVSPTPPEGQRFVTRSVLFTDAMPCHGLEKNKLFCVDQKFIGAPVYSVAWLCECGVRYQRKTLAAVAGGMADGANIRVYELVGDGLVFVAAAKHGGIVRSVDWCCIDGVAYLAVGGTRDDAGDEVEVFVLEDVPEYAGSDRHGGCYLKFVGTWSHGATVNSVAWLCRGCHDYQAPQRRMLAVGGDTPERDSAEIRILQFDMDATPRLAVTGSFMHGAPIHSVGWCEQEGGAFPLLAAAGEQAASCEGGFNLRLLALGCPSGEYALLDSQRVPCACIDVLRWCCTNCPFIFVAGMCQGEGGARDAKLMGTMYKLLLANGKLMAQSSSNLLPATFSDDRPQGSSILALGFVSRAGCPCEYVTVGGSMSDAGVCPGNIVVYRKGADGLYQDVVTMARFDTTVSSLSWCAPNRSGCSYLLVGAQPRISEDPMSHECKPEIALYKASFEGCQRS